MVAPIQLEILDLFPERRGAATSVSSFLNLFIAALLPAFMVPALGHSLVTLAYGALSLSIAGTIFWIWHLLRTKTS